MKKKQKNIFDQIISDMIEELPKITNFELTQTDGKVNRLYNFVITRFAEIHDYQALYKKYYIPAANKSIVDIKKEWKSSFYNKTFDISDDQLKANYYDTIRLGYVGLFHKVENYVKDLLVEANLIFNDGNSSTDSIESFYKKRYDFKFNDWYSNIITHRINWICNCVKHYDGYPKKLPKYQYLDHLPEEEKLKIDHTEFYKDMEYIVDLYYKAKLEQVLSLSLFKMLSDDVDINTMSEDLKEKYIIAENNFKDIMSKNNF